MSKKTATRRAPTMKLLPKPGPPAQRPPAPPAISQPPAPTPAADPAPEAVYSFSTRSRCRRCGSVNTIAYKTKGERQYRICRVAICRHRYSEAGQLI